MKLQATFSTGVLLAAAVGMCTACSGSTETQAAECVADADCPGAGICIDNACAYDAAGGTGGGKVKGGGGAGGADVEATGGAGGVEATGGAGGVEDAGGAGGEAAPGGAGGLEATGGAGGEAASGGAGGEAAPGTGGEAARGGAGGETAPGGAGGEAAPGGAGGAGAAPVTGGAPTTGGAGGTGGTVDPPSGAMVRLCHSIGHTDGSDAVMTMTIDGQTLTAVTGTCSTGCVNIGSGEVSVSFSADGDVFSSGTFTVEEGEELLVEVELEDGSLEPTFTSATGLCSGGDGGTGTQAKFCNDLSVSGSPVELTLDVDSVEMTALTGNCAPAAGCTALSSGTGVPLALYDGADEVVTGAIDLPANTQIVLVTLLDDDGPSVKYYEAPGTCDPLASASIRKSYVPSFQASTAGVFKRSGIPLK